MDKKYNTYLPREIQKPLNESLSQFPASLITGPRQAGKSTLLQKTLKNYNYANLDDLAMRALARRDPKYFFEQYPPPVIIDEIQYAPDLLSYIKIQIDKNRSKTGQFVLTGSQTFQIMKGVSESLAGRIAIFDLYPLTWKELNYDPFDRQTLLSTLLSGFYPEIHSKQNLNQDLWFRTYIRTYAERDVRDIKAVTDLSQIQVCLQVLAARAGQILNLKDISKEIGIAVSTVKEWLSILESTYIIKLLRPYFKNANKRLVKSPKLYFVDTGLLCHLLGLSDPAQLEISPFRGALFENMVIMEVIKKLESSLSPLKPYFYKTSNDLEVDLILATVDIQKAYEIKFSMTPRSRMGESLVRLKQDFPNTESYLVSLSKDCPGFPGMKDIRPIHWSKMLDHF